MSAATLAAVKSKVGVVLGLMVAGSLGSGCVPDPEEERAQASAAARLKSELASDTSASAAMLGSADQAERDREALQRHLQEVARAPRLRAPVREAAADPTSVRYGGSKDAMEFGMIGLLNSGAGGGSALGPGGGSPSGLWGSDPADAFGAGGIGLSGAGGGTGFGSGSRKKPPQVRMGATSVSGRLPPEVIQRIVRQNFGRFRLCYENGLRSDPTLAGRVTVKFTINGDGSVGGVSNESDMPDAGVVSCVAKAFYGLSFPQPEAGKVTVTYPIIFSPGDPPAEASKSPGASGSFTSLNGKPLATATWEDVKVALEKAGCTDVTKVDDPAIVEPKVVFTAKKDGKKVTITFVTKATIDEAELKALEAAGSVYVTKLFALGIVVEDDTGRTASKALLDAVIVR